MSDLFDKLNLLLRASLDNLRTNHPATSEPANQETVPPEGLTARSIADLERQVATMRKQIDAALSSEDAMQERLNKLQEQIAAYDQAADAALDRGDEDEARRLITQMQQQRRLATMVNAELEDHRSATSEFIVRVNMLEATVGDAKRAQGQEPSDPATSKPAVTLSPELVEFGKNTATALNDVMRTLREHAEAALAPMVPRPNEQPSTMPTNAVPAIKQETSITPDDVPAVSIKVKSNPTTDMPATPAITQETPIPTANDAPAVNIKVKSSPTTDMPTAPTSSIPAPAKPVSDKDVEDDLARRRSRLSKPD